MPCVPARLMIACSVIATFAMPAVAAPPQDETERTLYALGALISGNLATFGLTKKEADLVARGLVDATVSETPVIDLATYAPKVEALQATRQQAAASSERAAGAAYLAKAATEPGAARTSSGLVQRSLVAGSGAKPTATNRVKVHYEGRLIDGTVFDSSIARGEPASFALSGVIPCWTEAMQAVKVGGKTRIVCPPELAYGDNGSPPVIPGGATLVFEVELLAIEP